MVVEWWFTMVVNNHLTQLQVPCEEKSSTCDVLSFFFKRLIIFLRNPPFLTSKIGHVQKNMSNFRPVQIHAGHFIPFFNFFPRFMIDFTWPKTLPDLGAQAHETSCSCGVGNLKFYLTSSVPPKKSLFKNWFHLFYSLYFFLQNDDSLRIGEVTKADGRSEN